MQLLCAVAVAVGGDDADDVAVGDGCCSAAGEQRSCCSRRSVMRED